jgi:glyoxylase-like metal-dependent hydrolase (beta-lactamase superfamily II)
MTLRTIDTGNFKLDGGAMFGVVPKQIWQKLYPPDERNLCNWAMRCLLVETHNRRILIDTGIGSKQDERFLGHYFLNGSASLQGSLAALGFAPASITDVVLTHLHFDHCGGAVERVNKALVPTFPNAQYWTNEAHWQWATAPNDREKASFLKENILPLAESGQLRFVAPGANGIANFDGLPGFDLRFVDGHTRAMMLPQLKVSDKTVVFMADLIPSTAHLPLPYVMGYDMFPYTTLQEKKQFLDEALAGHYVLFFEHDAYTPCCTLQMTEKGIRAASVGPLSQFIA